MSELLKKLTSVSSDSLWYDFTQKECVQSELKKIEKTLKDQKKWDDRTPASPEKILRFLDTDLSNIKVVILGQDPYPQKGVATGRAFEVDGLNSWCEKDKKKMNYSLKNILKAIYIAYSTSDTISIKEVRGQIGNGNFVILSPDKWFEKMEDQGVLFLNTAFTCKIGEPNSHSEIWKSFTHKIIHYIVTKNPECTWFIWGDNAKKITNKYKIENKHETSHPVVASFYKEENCFIKTKGKIKRKDDILINWLGS